MIQRRPSVTGVPCALLSSALVLTVTLVAGCSDDNNYTTVVEGMGPAGLDGLDGEGGTDGIGFDYARGIDGATVSQAYWIGEAGLVIPEVVLAFAPQEMKPREGLVLVLGDMQSMARYYLVETALGEYHVIEKGTEPGEFLGQIDFAADGHLVVVELLVLQALGTLPDVLATGVIVELQEPAELDLRPNELRVGDVRIKSS